MIVCTGTEIAVVMEASSKNEVLYFGLVVFLCWCLYDACVGLFWVALLIVLWANSVWYFLGSTWEREQL